MQFDFTRALRDGFSKEEIINAFASSMDTDINWQAVDEQYLKQGKSDEFFELLKNPNNYTIYGKKQKEQDPQEIPQNAQLNLQAPLNENAFNAQANLDKTLQQEEPQAQNTLQSPQELSKWEHLKLALGGESIKETQERKAQEAQANTEIKNALKSGIAFDDLSEDLKQKAQLLGKGEISYKQDLRRDELMAKDEQGNWSLKEWDLSDEDRELIKKDLGFFNSLFTSEKDEFKEWRLKQEVQAQDTKTQQDLAKIQESLNNLQRYHKSGSLSLLFDSNAEKKAVQEEKLDKIQGFAENLGFDGIGVNNDGDVFAYKGDKALWLNEGFFDNFSDVLLNNSYGIAGSVAGGMLGSTLAGAKAGRALGSVGGLGGQVAGGILGSAIGAFGGGMLDALNTQLKNKEEINAKFLENMLRVGNEEMIFDLAGGSVGTYALANGKKILTAPLKATKKLSENFVATGLLKNLTTNQNLNAAKDLLDANIPKEVQEDLKSFANAYGGNLKMQEEVLGLTQAKESLSAKYGEDSILTKTASALEKLALEHNTQNAQKELLELIRADSSGQALGMLYQVAKESPKANDNLKSLLNKTTQALNKELESLNLNPQTLKEIYKELESGTKESYDIATNKVLLDLYKNERITLNRGNYDSLRLQLENNAELETSALSFLKFVENSIFNPQGVGLEQLINARKTLNGFVKDTRDSNTKGYLKSIVENHLHKEINNGINKIFESNPHFYQQATNLYNNSLSDYATMKETLKNLKKLGFLDEAKSNENLTDKFIKYIQGDGGLESKNNFIELTKGLSEQNKQAIELNVLNRIYQRNLLKDNGIEVFASRNFLKETQKVKEVFTSKGAKEFIELMEGFNKLFGNDAEIALKMGYATPKVEGSSIATTIEGAVQQKMIKGIFGILMRNLPHNSLVIKGLGLSENVQGQALRYHLKKALENTNDIHAFKVHLTQNADKQHFNNATMQVLKEILTEVDTLKQEVLREGESYKNAQTGFKSDILDKTQPLRMLENGELNDTLLKQAKAKNLKLWVGNLENEQLAKELGLDSTKPIKITMQGNAIAHIEKRHGANSVMAQNGQPSIQTQDYANHAKIVNAADKNKIALSNDNQKILVSGKQVNGYYIIIESISTKNNELKLKTMYKENGSLEDSLLFKNARALTDHNNGGESLRVNPSNSLDFHARENLTTKDRIKQARELGLSPKEAVEFIKNKNLPQPSTNTLPQNKEILEAEIVEPQEIPHLQKKLIEWIQQRAQLIAPNQQARLSTRDLIDFARAQNLPPKQAIKLINNTPRNLPILKEKATKISPSSGNTNTEQNINTLREVAKAHLKPRINKDIVNLNTQEVATLTNKGIRKMISDKAVSKSVANGFSQAEHFKAVNQITELFEKAQKATSYKDPIDINLTIHRYNAPFENANALLTLKEYEQNGKKIYSLELEELNAIKFNPSGKDLMEQFSKSKDIDTASFNAPSENPNAILPQNQEKLKQIEAFKKEFNLSENSFKPLGSISEDGEILTEKGYFKVLEVNEKDGYVITFESIEQYRGEYHFNKPMVYDLQGRYLGVPYIDGEKVKNAKELFIKLGEVKPFTIGKNKSLQQALKATKPKQILADAHQKRLRYIDKVVKTKTRDGKEVNYLQIQGSEIDPITAWHSGDLAKLDYNIYKNAITHVILKQRENTMLKALEKGINEEYFSDLQKQLAQEILEKSKDKNALLKLQKEDLENKLLVLDKNEEWAKKNRDSYDAMDFSKSREKLKQEIAEIQKEISNAQNAQNVESKNAFKQDLTTPKQKTIQKIESYAKSDEFKALSKDKQEAILSLKTIQPSPMLEEISQENLENLFKHFSSKQDKAQREFYAKLLSDTKENPHIVLEAIRDNELKKEYIKAYQHKDTHDIYYIVATKQNDSIVSTGLPTTQIRKVINNIASSERVISGGSLGDTTNRQADKVQSPKLADDILPQNWAKFIQKNYPHKLDSDPENARNKREAQELLKEGRFFDSWREHPLILKKEIMLTKDKQELELLKLKHKNGEIFYIEPLTRQQISKDAIKNVDYDVIKAAMVNDLQHNNARFREALSGLNSEHFGRLQEEAMLKYFEINKDYKKHLDFNLSVLDYQSEHMKKRILDEQETYKMLKNSNDEKYNFIKLRNERTPSGYTFLNSKFLISFKDISTDGERALRSIFGKGKNNTERYDNLMMINNCRHKLERDLNIEPIKEFGTNYSEFYRDGKGGIQKLITEAEAHKESGKEGEFSGQVAGAFYREELGDIDLVWGDSKKGLQHILERRTQDFIEKGFSKAEAEQKALEFVKTLPDIIENGNIDKGAKRVFLDTENERAVIALDYNGSDGKWILTAYIKDDKAPISAYPHQNKLTDSTSSPIVKSALAEKIIPQQAQSPQEIIKEAKASGKSVKETKELIQKNKELQEANTQKIQEVKEKLKALNKESRDLAYNVPASRYLFRGWTKTRDEKYLDYKQRFGNRLEEKGIFLDYMELEKIKRDTTLKGKARKEAMDTIYLRMYENMQQADKEAKERARAFAQQIRERDLQEANEWLEKNKGASSDVDYEYKRKIAEIDKNLDLTHKLHPNDTEFIDLMNRERGKLTYAKNGDLGVVRLPEVENFYWRGYPMDLKVLQDIQKEHNYTDKNLIINGRDFSKSFEVMRAEIEARIGIKPLQEFGTNYAEHYHSGETAIQKLLTEAQAFKESGQQGEFSGQVAGAFYREELGDIDLVWGDSNFGLKHILDKHGSEFENIAKQLDEIIQNGEVVKRKGRDEAYNIEYKGFKVGINKGFNKQGENKWVVTAFDDNIEKTAKTAPANDSTKGANLPLNSNNILPQSPQEIIKEAKQSGKSVKETKELIAQNKEIQKQTLPLETIQLNTLKNIKSYADLVGLPIDTKGAKAFKDYLQTRLKDIEC